MEMEMETRRGDGNCMGVLIGQRPDDRLYPAVGCVRRKSGASSSR